MFICSRAEDVYAATLSPGAGQQQLVAAPRRPHGHEGKWLVLYVHCVTSIFWMWCSEHI